MVGFGKVAHADGSCEMSQRRRSSVAVGYARLLGGDGSAELERQRRAIRLEVRRRGLSVAWSCDTSDRRDALDRSGLARSLRLLEGERHKLLIVADLTYLTSSLSVLSGIFRRSVEKGWAVVSLGSPSIDTTRREGRILQSVFCLYDTIDDGCITETPVENEVRDLGQASSKDRIVWERIVGASLGRIANDLNGAGVAGPKGIGSWSPSAVWAELETLRPPGARS